MDNLSSHKGTRVRQMIEAAGASLLYLPPYSPDFNPIENAFSELKALLREAEERTVAGLWDAVGRIVALYTSAECANYFAAAGYDAVGSEMAPAATRCALQAPSSTTRCNLRPDLWGNTGVFVII